jgi:tripartite-type tricarboxylate transporter receptor subunit TctC
MNAFPDRRGPHLGIRFFIAAFAALVATALPASAAGAEDWPTGPVRIIVPFGPGSTPDIVARLVADKLSPRLGKPVIVENKVGAGGNIGTDAVAKAAPDGQTIGLSISGPLAVNALLYRKLPYDS